VVVEYGRCGTWEHADWKVESSIGGQIASQVSARKDIEMVSTKDTIKGIAREAKGEVEQAIGSVINRPDIKAKGKKDRAVGRVQRKADDSKQIG
jgi:uncharacterized protein YjbJ (UPF0337 family)